MVDPVELAKAHRHKMRQAAQLATARRAQEAAENPPAAQYAGYDASSGQALLRMPNGELIRAQPLYNTLIQPGDPVILDPSTGRPFADQISAWQPEPEPIPEPISYGKLKVLFSTPDGKLWIGGDRKNPKRIGAIAQTPEDIEYKFRYFLSNLGDGDRFAVVGISIPSSAEDEIPYLAVHFPRQNRLIEFTLDVPIPNNAWRRFYPTWDGSGICIIQRNQVAGVGGTLNFLPGFRYGISGTAAREDFVTYEIYANRTTEHPGFLTPSELSRYYPLYPGADSIETKTRGVDVQISGQRNMYWFDESQTAEFDGWMLDASPACYWDIYPAPGTPIVVGGMGYEIGGTLAQPNKVNLRRVDLTSEDAVASNLPIFTEFTTKVFDTPENAIFEAWSYHP